MVQKKILIIDDNVEVVSFVETLLALENHAALSAFNGKRGLEMARAQQPDLILLDLDLPDYDGIELCRTLKSDSSTKFIPVIMLTGTRREVPDKLLAYETGADAFLLKPFYNEELKAEISRLLEKTGKGKKEAFLPAFPGIEAMHREIEQRIEKKNKFSVCYIDIDNFKYYNGFYGFRKGDLIIEFLAGTIKNAIKNVSGSVACHIGGDNFIVITEVEKVDSICKSVIDAFDREIINYYNNTDIQNGFFKILGRNGELKDIPVMTLSIGITDNVNRTVDDYNKLVDFLVDMKKYVKRSRDRKGSVYMKDRRGDRSPARQDKDKGSNLNPFM